MKSKYYLALKFFNETKNDEQLKLCYKEVEGFFDNYAEFKFYIELDCLNLDPKVEAQLNDEEKEQLNNEDFQSYFNFYRFKECEDIFSNYKYNFELFKYALEKVFEEERKLRDEKEAMQKSQEKPGGYNTLLYAVLFFLVTAGVLYFSGFGGLKAIK
jgi:hypothetical protein